jgi:hypothetical protein
MEVSAINICSHILQEAWYTPGIGIHSATGWLEEKLRNVRRRSITEGNKSKSEASTSQPSSKLVKIGALPGK